jgi:hypothetical protein
VQAEALRRLVSRMAATYEAAADQGTTLAFQESWGLWRRSLALTALIKPDLGPQKNTVAGALNALRGTAYADGPNVPDQPKPEKVDSAQQRVGTALDKRFRFGSI